MTTPQSNSSDDASTPPMGLDLSSSPPQDIPSSQFTGRPFIGISFDCCGVYQRVYLNDEGTHYNGRCPKCLATVQLVVGPGGTSTRIFRAS